MPVSTTLLSFSTCSAAAALILCLLLSLQLANASLPGCGDDDPAVYDCVKKGCDLIQCPYGKKCDYFIGIAKLGTGPFERFEYPKCVSNPSEVNNTTPDDGNNHLVVDGPGCKSLQCSEGYQCEVQITTTKFGNRPYAQAIGGFPQCVNANGGSFQEPYTSIPGGPGCDQWSCPSYKKCVTITGITKYGHLPWSQFFEPICV